MSQSLSPIAPHSHLVQNYGARMPVRFVRGYGCYLYDDQDRKYVDCLAGIAVNVLGHNYPALSTAIRDQVGQLIHTSNLFHVGPQEELAAMLCAKSFADRAFFCNSGTEANEAALKIARLWGNVKHKGAKTRLIAAEGAFHGRTLGALSLTANPAYKKDFEPLIPVEFVPYGDAAALEAIMADDVAAVFLEPLQGEGGVRVPPEGYLKRVRELCTQHESLFVLDEIQTGIGRTGTVFAYEQEACEPDIMTLAKGLGGGMPIGAVLMREELADLLQPGLHGTTFGGNHLACAAANAVMKEVCNPYFLENVMRRGAWLREALVELFGDRAVEVRGRGFLIGVQLQADDPVAALVATCLENGLVCGSAGGNVLRFAPPLTMGEVELADVIEKMQTVLK